VGRPCDKSVSGKVKTFFACSSAAMLFERSTWHCAQHARQLAAVLKVRHRAGRDTSRKKTSPPASAGRPLGVVA